MRQSQFSNSVDSHYRDLALLCSVVPDPFNLAAQLTAKDRQRLRRACALADDSHS
jgi:hypothetical protein